MEDKKILAEFLGYKVKHGTDLEAYERFLGDFFTIHSVDETLAKNVLYCRLQDELDAGSDVFTELDSTFNELSFEVLAEACKKFLDLPDMRYTAQAHKIMSYWSQFDKENVFKALVEGIEFYNLELEDEAYLETIEESEKRTLLVSRYRTPDGTLLVSKHRHDFVSHLDKNGKQYSLDGGYDYKKISGKISDLVDESIYSSTDHSMVREVVERGTYGIDGTDPYKQVLVKDIDDDWLINLIDYERKLRPDNKFLPVYENEKEFRKNGKVLHRNW